MHLCKVKKIKYIIIFLSIVTFFIIYLWWSNINTDHIYLEILPPVEDYYKSEDNFIRNDKKLFDLDFEYVISSDGCNVNDTISIVFIVTSYFGNVETRSSMRRTFSNAELKKLNIKRVFLLGLAPNDKYTNQLAIIDESRKFKDIVQGNFQEAYKNLTYKQLMGLQWAETYCNNTKFIVKMDDDIVVNFKKFIDLLKEIKFPNRLLAGYVLKGLSPKREPQNKWYVSVHEYPGNMYPPFLSGWLYVTNPSTARELVYHSHHENYFWIDDLFITGMLAKKIKIKHFDLNKYFAVHAEFLQCCMRDLQRGIHCDIIVGPNGGDNNLFYKFNEALKICSKIKCKHRRKPLNETCVAEVQQNLGRGDVVIENYKLH